MKRHLILFILLMMISATFVLCVSAPAVYSASDPPDILIKIHRIEHTLNRIDSMAQSGTAPSVQPPSMFIRAMLQGTDWIDSNRLIVIGLWFKDLQVGQKPMMAALIPFAKPNDTFKMTYNAVSGNDYYILPLPLGTVDPVTGRMELGLVAGSKSKPDRPEGIVSLEIAAAQLLEKADRQV